MSREEREPIVGSTGYMHQFRRRSSSMIAEAKEKVVNRYMALALMSFMGFGVYYCYDNPAALEEDLKAELKISTTEFTLMYSINSWPNIVFSFFGGYFIDRYFGIRLGTLLYLILVVIGQFFFAFGGLTSSYWTMIFGRFIFGIGSESLAVAQNNYAVIWFKGRELNFAFGLQLSVARMGSAFNFWTIQPLYKFFLQYFENMRAIGVVLMMAMLTNIVSLICGIFLNWLDKRKEILMHEDTHPRNKVHLSDIFTFKSEFWMLSILCAAYYVAIFPFVALGQAFFMERYNMPSDAANRVNSIIFVMSAIGAPIFGYIIDEVGRNVFWIFTATSITLFAQALIAFTEVNPYIDMTIMGLGYSALAASLWPLIALIVPEYQLGLAYGFCQSVQNLGLSFITIIAGIIVDSNGGNHFWMQVFFMMWLILALFIAVFIWYYDHRINGILNLTPDQLDKYHSPAKYVGIQ